MNVDLFAGIPVSDFRGCTGVVRAALGREPSFLPNDTEAVWGVAEHGWVFIEHRPDHAGHAMHTVFVDDLDARSPESARGIEPTDRETYSNGVQKVTTATPTGTEIGFGGTHRRALCAPVRRPGLAAPQHVCARVSAGSLDARHFEGGPSVRTR